VAVLAGHGGDTRRPRRRHTRRTHRPGRSVMKEALAARKAKVALAGLGYWGPNLLRSLVALAGSEHVVGVDRALDRADSAAGPGDGAAESTRRRVPPARLPVRRRGLGVTLVARAEQGAQHRDRRGPADAGVRRPAGGTTDPALRQGHQPDRSGQLRRAPADV